VANDLIPVQSLERMAQAIANSKLFGVTNVDQALALMLVAQAEGLHPATAARDYHIIQGRPALKADAMLARYLNSGGKVEWHEHTDLKVAATFTHPAGGSLKIEWDIPRAKAAGLDGKDMWKKYPRQMLRARVISEGIRATNPAVAVGIYTPEEVQDMEPEKRRGKPQEPKNMGPAEVVQPEAASQADERAKITPEQTDAIHTALSEAGVTMDQLLAKAELTDLADMASEDAPGAIKWIKKQKSPAK
jgi:hypothetical protein